ncbi:hypothetical protein [Sporosarcina obsidiansis]|nr:hypothetical protein [Sporosarcina obsidiansis]
MWIGVVTVGAVVINIIFFGESKSIGRVVIFFSVVGLKVLS